MIGPVPAADAAVLPPGYAADAAGLGCGGVIGEGLADAADIVVLTDPAAEAGLALIEKEAPLAAPWRRRLTAESNSGRLAPCLMASACSEAK